MRPIFSKSTHNLEIETYPTGPLQTNSTFVIDKDTKKVIIIDGGHQFELTKEIIESKNLSVDKIIHTHTHFDHAGATSKIKEVFGGKISFKKDDEFIYKMMKEQGLFFGMNFDDPQNPDKYIEDFQEITFKDSDSIKFNVIPTPGHTPGGICFFTSNFDTPILVAGDTLFNGSIGRTDLPGGDHPTLLNSIKTNLFSLPDETIVICGHGPCTTIGKEKSSNPFLV